MIEKKVKIAKKYTVIIFKSPKNNEWGWRIVHRNGSEICRASETYINRSDCLKAFYHLIDGVLEDQVNFSDIPIRAYKKMER